MMTFEEWAAIRQEANALFGALPGFVKLEVEPVVHITAVVDGNRESAYNKELLLMEKFPTVEFHFDVRTSGYDHVAFEGIIAVGELKEIEDSNRP